MPTRGNRKGQSPEQESPQLRATAQDARDKIEMRISEGKQLLAVPISDNATLEHTNAGYDTWDEYNLALLERLFTTNKLVQEYRGVRQVVFNPPFPKAVQRLKEHIQDSIRRLESIRDRLDLYEDTTVAVSQSQSQRRVESMVPPAASMSSSVAFRGRTTE